MPDIRLTDVIVATVLPFTEKRDIDWASYSRLLDYCTTPDGISSVFVNGHAGEGAALTPEERVQVIEYTRKYLNGTKPLMTGIIPYSTGEAIRQTRDAKAAGADIAVLFPMPQMAAGGTRTPDVPLAYVKAVLDAVDIPISIFQYPLGSGMGYPTETLVEIAKLGSRVLAIKEGSDTLTAYEDNWRLVKKAAPKCAILPSNFDWFLGQVAVGADGILSGLASLTPHMLIDLWRAAEKLDLKAMRQASDQLYPVVRTIYGAPPRMDMHTRIKEGLKHLGIIESAVPRAPLLPVAPDITARVRKVVDEAALARHVGAAAPRHRAAS
ncbi:MAG: dihydrodipicolinate synthase family protein [Rhodospirillales bacterium]|nr:dihydrodipicolinate synthase family protein [Rhodospirillales bacterium]